MFRGFLPPEPRFKSDFSIDPSTVALPICSTCSFGRFQPYGTASETEDKSPEALSQRILERNCATYVHMSAKPSNLDIRHQNLRPTAHHARATPYPIYPSWTYTLVFRVLAGLSLVACLILQCVCAVIISQYSPSHSMKGEERFRKFLAVCESVYFQSFFHTTQIPILRPSGNPSLPDFLIDPSAAVFINAVMIHTSAVLVSYNMAGDSQQLGCFLAIGALSGILIGVSLAWTGTTLEALKDSIPISITAALALGQLWHAVQSRVLGIARLQGSS